MISIIGVLVGLLLPAIQAAREAGRRAKCQSNLHNIILGILGYLNDNNEFPHSGMFCEDPTDAHDLTSPPPPYDDPRIHRYLETVPCGHSRGQQPAGHPMYSWVMPILPYIDSQELFNQWTDVQAAPGVRFTIGFDLFRQRRQQHCNRARPTSASWFAPTTIRS